MKRATSSTLGTGEAVGTGTSRGRAVAMAGLLVAATLAAYAPVRNNGFVNFDDPLYVTRESHVATGLSVENVVWALTAIHAANWHPLTSLSHMLDVEMFGIDPRAHHLMSLAFHAANAVLLFLLLRRMTGELHRSALVAFLFALHPLHVESVAWASERKDVLSTLLWILTTWAYMRWVERRGRARYFVVTALFVSGLLSKPMLVTLPVTLLLLDVWPLGRVRPEATRECARLVGRLVLEKVPLLLLAAAAAVATLAVQSAAGAVAPVDRLPPLARLANATVSYATYLRSTLWPSGLAFFYPFDRALSAVSIAASGGVLIGLTALAVAFVRRAPFVAVGWFWYLLTLLPVIGLVQVGGQARADRYTYVPLIGIFVIAAWSLPARLGDRRSRAIPIAALVAAALLVLALLTHRQVGIWRNSETLCEHAIAVTTGNGFAHYNLAHELSRRNELPRAASHYEEAIRIRPEWLDANFNLASTLAKLGRLDESAAVYGRALRLDPGDAGAHNALGTVLMRLGRLNEADARFREALRLKPDLAEAHNNMGVLEASRGNTDAAIAAYREALRIRPDYEKARDALSRLLASPGR